ncbi:hypothetical protein O3P69_014893 [Scylla paramamosain]|uniref:Resistance to inhibitors of cholinesterase protein 3 N-terminal domain-containing protein n=1 Tax=Scylla paramamosain TaxID=85552 RepID=A0AAW0TYB1_SCYPA
MSGDFGTGKTIFVLAIVVGCFAVLWPKIFYPMLTASVKQPPSARQDSWRSSANVEFLTKLCYLVEEHYGGESRWTEGRCGEDLWQHCGHTLSEPLLEAVRLGKDKTNLTECLASAYGLTPAVVAAAAPPKVRPRPYLAQGPHTRPERPAHLYPEMVHPALREKGRAMPQRTLDKQARPGPMPGVRPPMGGAGGIVPPPQSKGSGAMGIIMPLYTVGIVVFFVYTIMKVLFKKGHDDDKTPKLKDFGLDPEYRKYVFAEEYLDNADASTRDQIRRQQREDSRTARRKFQQEMHPGATDTKIEDEQLDHLRRRLEETERAMERLMSQMGSVTDKLTAAKITEVLSQAQFQAKILKEEVSEITSEEDPSSEQFTATLSEDNSLPTSLRHHLQELQVDQLSSFSEALLGEVKQLQMGGRGGDILGRRDSTSEEEEPLEEDQVVVPEVKVDGVPVVSSPSAVDTSPPPPSPPQAEISTPGELQGEAPLEGKASSGVSQDGAAPKEGHTDVSAQQEEAVSEGDKAEAHDIASPPPKHPETHTTPAQPQDTQDKPAQVERPPAPEPTKVTPTGKEVTFKLPSESSSTSATGSEEGPSEATETGADISDFVSFAEENHQEEVCQPAQVVVQEDVPEVVYKAADIPQEAAVGTSSKGISTQTLPAASTEHSTQTEKEREIAVMGLDTSFKREKDIPPVPVEVPEILLDALLPSETQLLVKDTKDTNVEMESSEAGAVPCIVTSHVSLAILGLEGSQPGIPAPVQTSSPSTTDPKTVTATSTPQQPPAQPPTTIPEQPATTTPEQPATTTPEQPATTTPTQPPTTIPEQPATTTPEQPAMVAPLFTSPAPVVSTITATQFTKEPTPERTPVIKETPKAEGDAVMIAPLFTSPAPVVSSITAAQFTKEPTPERTVVTKETPDAEEDSTPAAPAASFYATALPAVSTVTAAQFMKEPTPERTPVIKETPKAEGDAVMVAPLFTGPVPVVSTITADQFIKEPTPERTRVIKETPKAEGDAVMVAPLFTGPSPVVSTITADQFIKEPTPERTRVIKETPKAEGDAVMVAPLFTGPSPVVSTITADQFIKERTPERTKVIKETPKTEGDAVMVAPFFSAPTAVVSTLTADQFTKEPTPERTLVMKEKPSAEDGSVPAAPPAVPPAAAANASEPTPPTKTVGGKVVGEPPAPAAAPPAVEAMAEAIVASTTRAALDQLNSLQESSTASTDESSASTVLDREAAQKRVEAALAEAVREEAPPPAAPKPEESPASSKGSSPDMDEYEVITKEIANQH